MANHIGNSGTVTIGANILAEVVDYSITEAANVADDTVLGDAWSTIKAGTKNWSGSVSCYWDETDTLGQVALTVGASVALHLLPEGAGATNIDFNGTATVTGIERSVSNDSIVTAAFTFQGNGILNKSVL